MYFRLAPSAKNESIDDFFKVWSFILGNPCQTSLSVLSAIKTNIIYSGIIIIHVDNIIKDNTTQF